jgi:hypothetical protein
LIPIERGQLRGRFGREPGEEIVERSTRVAGEMAEDEDGFFEFV